MVRYSANVSDSAVDIICEALSLRDVSKENPTTYIRTYTRMATRPDITSYITLSPLAPAPFDDAYNARQYTSLSKYTQRLHYTLLIADSMLSFGTP